MVITQWQLKLKGTLASFDFQLLPLLTVSLSSILLHTNLPNNVSGKKCVVASHLCLASDGSCDTSLLFLSVAVLCFSSERINEYAAMNYK